MIHKDVYKFFKMYFPSYTDNNVDVWFPNGKDSIRVREKNGFEFIFTYHDKNNWKLETINSFLKNMNGGRTA